MQKTSVSHPIYVDWLVEVPGRIGLTFAPGKHAASKYGSGTWARDLDADLDKLVTDGMRVQVCLLEDHELTRLRIPGLVAAAEKRGVRLLRLPIPDGGVLVDVSPVRSLVKEIVAHASKGDDVVIHCMGGLGRAGTIGGCTLLALGKSHHEALAILREKRGVNCPETDGQRAFIRAFSP